MAQIIKIDSAAKTQGKKTRVAAYCRVSSSSADQLNSYARQLSVYKAMIEKRPDWELVEIFADEGISGTAAEKRPDFQRMIKACELKRIDLIVTKSVSRFARNVKEALEYVRKLKVLGVGVMFEKEGINTQSMADEMLLNTFAAIAQEESVSISQNLRMANLKRMEKGEYKNSSVPFGFRRENGVLVPHETEAAVIRQMYDLYLSGWSTQTIAEEFNRLGVPTKTGTNQWKHNHVAKILKNEKNVGDSMYQKSYTEGFPFKKKVNRGEENKYYTMNTHEAIVSRDVYNAVLELLEKRRVKFAAKKERTDHALSGKIRCAGCGAAIVRKEAKGRERWCCRSHLLDSKSCSAHYVQTERIENGFIMMVNNLRFGGNVLPSVEGQLIHTIQQFRMNDEDSQGISKEIAELNGQMLMLEQLFGKGYIAADVYQTRYREISTRLGELKNTKALNTLTLLEDTLKKIRDLKEKIYEIEEPVTAFDPELFGQIVVSGTLSENDELTLEFIGGLKFTEQI